MMDALRYTLLSDGSSDQALVPILTWLLRAQGIHGAIQPEWADLRRLPKPPHTLSERISLSLDLYPCDLLFVHRDAEGDLQHVRTEEIHQALAAAAQRVQIPPTVCVVPVRMQEAWLLFDEQAIRWAAGNPHGRASLVLPPLNTLAQLPDAKRVLYDLLREASGLTGRRRRQFRAPTRARRVAEVINDFSPLRTLCAFRRLEDEIRRVVHTHGWHRC